MKVEKKKEKSNLLFSILQAALIICVLIIVTTISIYVMGVEIQSQSLVTYEKCCNNMPCSDTYYDEESKTCKNVFEEQMRYSPFGNWGVPSLLIVIGVAIIFLVITHFLTLAHNPKNERRSKIKHDKHQR